MTEVTPNLENIQFSEIKQKLFYEPRGFTVGFFFGLLKYILPDKRNFVSDLNKGIGFVVVEF